MKMSILPAAWCAALICLIPLAGLAQTGGPAGQPDRPKWSKPGNPDRQTPGLDREEARRLAAAREKAKADPTVRSLQEAREAIERQLESAVNAAMLSADPGLASTLEKVKQSRERAKGMRDQFQTLTPEQKEELKSARQSAQSDPAVAAAREQMKSADSPEARREAGRAMQEAMKAAITKQNPDLAPLLEQLGPPRGPKGPPSGMARED